MRTITFDAVITFDEMDDDYSPEMALENLHTQLEESGVSFTVKVNDYTWTDENGLHHYDA